MNIFESLNEVLFTKETPELDADAETQYVPYMINRWVSMYSPQLSNAINDTVNWLWPLYSEDKQFHYKFCQTVLPSARRKHINYIKKEKQDKDPDEEVISHLASQLELSKREVKYLLNERKHRQTRSPKTPN